MRPSASAYDVFPNRILVWYVLALIIILLAASVVIIVGLTEITSTEYSVPGHGVPLAGSPAFSSGALVNATLITSGNSKLIYSSQVPESIVTGLDALIPQGLPVSAFPMTISLVEADGSYPLVVEGLPTSVIQTLISNFTGSQANESGENWMILGSTAASVLTARAGSNITLASPISGLAANATVVKIASFGNEKDYQAIVPLNFGQEIADDSPGHVTAIAIPSASGQQISSLFRSVYEYNLTYSGISGTIYFIDSSGDYYSVSVVHGLNSSVLLPVALPPGGYSILLVHNGLRMILGSLLTADNESTISMQSEVQGNEAYLSVKNQTISEHIPKLVTLSNRTVLPYKYDRTTNSWLFGVNDGQYNLLLSGANGFVNTTEPLVLIGNSTYDPSLGPSGSTSLNVTVSGTYQNISGYLLNVVDQKTGQIIFSSFVSGSTYSIPVAPDQSYAVTVLTNTSNVLQQQYASTLNASASVTFTLPYVPQIFRGVQKSDYSVLWPGFPKGSESFTFLGESTILSTIAVFGLVFALLSATIFVLGGQLAASVQTQVRSLKAVFPGKISSLVRIYLPMFAISFASAVAALFLSYVVFVEFNMGAKVQFLGYGLYRFPLIYIAAALGFLAMMSWIRISIAMVRNRPAVR